MSKKPKHINNFKLGGTGRHRSNVWFYPMVMQKDQHETGGIRHPTVKPVALVMDALLDCSTRGGIVLDPFGGSGTTLIAAEKTKRQARLIELDPIYCDMIIDRWQQMTGKKAVLQSSGKTFDDVRAERQEDAHEQG